MRFATVNTERLRIDSNGRIGTNGRAPSSYNNPDLLISGDNATLTIMGDGSTNNSSIAALKFRVAGASTGDYTKAGIFAKRMGGYNDLAMIFAMDTVADANGVNLDNEKMRLTSAGNVGIGTDNPTPESGFTKVLHVYDDSPQVLLERETGSGNVKAGFNAWSGNASLETFTATPLRIRTSGNTNQLYLNTNGKVGIGTDNPADKLSIYSAPNSLIFGAKDTSRGNHIFQLLADDAAGNGELRLYQNSGSGTHTKTVEIASSGDSYLTGDPSRHRN